MRERRDSPERRRGMPLESRPSSLMDKGRITIFIRKCSKLLGMGGRGGKKACEDAA